MSMPWMTKIELWKIMNDPNNKGVGVKVYYANIALYYWWPDLDTKGAERAKQYYDNCINNSEVRHVEYYYKTEDIR